MIIIKVRYVVIAVVFCFVLFVYGATRPTGPEWALGGFLAGAASICVASFWVARRAYSKKTMKVVPNEREFPVMCLWVSSRRLRAEVARDLAAFERLRADAIDN